MQARRLVHGVSMLVLALGSLANCAILARPARAADKPADKPNVVLILIDDLGWTDLACYGSKYYQTPNLDQLAAEGLRFTHAYAACPVCSPTRAALMTGKYPAQLHLTDYIPGERDPLRHQLLRPEFHQELPLEEQTLAEVLHAAGYRTAAIGKWHLGGAGFEPQKQGFDFAVGGIDRGSVASHFAPYFPKDGRQLPGLENPPQGENITERLTSEAEKFLEQNATRPFFLYLPHYTVHTPLHARAEHISKYEAVADGGLQRNPTFAAMVEEMDTSVGRILKKLDELKLRDNTLVIFTSDNGGLATSGNPTNMPATNNAPLREGKGYLYEGGVRVALIARWPGVIAPGTTTSVPTSTIDLPPTIAAACHAKFSGPLDGVSILPVLEGKSTSPHEALFWHYPHYSPQGGHPGGSIRQGDFKLIEFYDSHRRELYNLAADPGENMNLIEREPERAAQLTEKLHAWLKDTGAEMPTPNPDFVPNPQAPEGTVTLPAETADIHGVMLRYEPLPHKDTLGFWVRPEDRASWTFRITKPGTFKVEILQGCGAGNGGSTVDFTVGEQKLTTTVEDTGGFQNFKRRAIGTFTLDKPGDYTLNVKPRNKKHVAVMDLREVRLVP